MGMMTTMGMMMMIKSWVFFRVFSYLSYLVESTVNGDLRQVQAIERKSYAHGYGSDAGGGDTALLLKYVTKCKVVCAYSTFFF